jgi:signal transduction histidine kinase
VIRPFADRCLRGEHVRYADWFDFPSTGRRFMDISYSPYVDHDQRIVGFVVNGRDITESRKAEMERVLLEAQLRQSQKLEAIGTLAGGVAHEINNPVNGIMNYAQLILDRLGPDHEVAEYAVEIGKEATRVAKIVEDLLSFARREKHERRPTHLSDILDSTLSLLRTNILRDQITLEVALPDDLPSVQCRSQQIRQVFVNLLTNAMDSLNEKYPRDHDRENKKITIVAHIFEKQKSLWIRITVADDGTGVTQETRERMFDPFFTTKPRYMGTGLGLSISHGIIKDHGGQISVESEEGEYTRFHIDLPAED